MEDRRIERTERTGDSGLGIVLAIILTALIVGGGIFWWKSASPAPRQDDNKTNINVQIPNPLDINNGGNGGNTDGNNNGSGSNSGGQNSGGSTTPNSGNTTQ